MDCFNVFKNECFHNELHVYKNAWLLKCTYNNALAVGDYGVDCYFLEVGSVPVVSSLVSTCSIRSLMFFSKSPTRLPISSSKHHAVKDWWF